MMGTLHSEEVMRIMQPKPLITEVHPKPSEIVSLDKIEEVSAEELPIRIASCADMNTPLVCLVAGENCEDEISQLKKLSEHLSQEGPLPECTYVFMDKKEAAKATEIECIGTERFAEPVYVLFFEKTATQFKSLEEVLARINMPETNHTE